MAVGLGFLVGFAIKKFGRGDSILYGLTGGILSLVGCVLGNLFFYAGAISNEFSVSIAEVALMMILDPLGVAQLMVEAFELMDLVFYGVATYIGFITAYEKTPKPAPQASTPA